MSDSFPNDLAGWTRRLEDHQIPVLGSTVSTLAGLAADEERVDVRTLAAAILDDPLMTLKLLTHVARHRPSRVATDIETVTAALLLMGIPPFFSIFEELVQVEDRLAGNPAALAGLNAVLRRSHRAAQFAAAIAAQRGDADVEVIREAALLHDFAEVLVWCHAPQAMLEIRRRQDADPTLRSEAAQQRLLGVALCDLQQALMKRWKLPELLIRITDDRHAELPQVLNVVLATRLARHSQDGWDNPALPDDFQALADLLQLSPEAARKKVMDLGV